MLVIRERQVSIMILFAVALHLWWAAMILTDTSALNATGVAALHRYLHHPMLVAAVCGGAGLMALASLAVKGPWMIFLLLPQQIVLMMSAAGAIEAMWLAQFADGVIRPRAFIASDQMYSVLAAIGHTAAITAHSIRRWVPINGRRRGGQATREPGPSP